MKKEDVLVVCGLNANTTRKMNNDETPNRWYIHSSEEIIKKIQAKIDTGAFSKIVFVDSDVSIFTFKETSKMNIKMYGKNLFSSENEISIIDHDGQVQVFNGDQFDFLLPPKTYNLNIAGIDLVGILSSSVVELSKANYYIAFNPSLVKSYKDVTYQRVKGHCRIEKG